MMRLREGGCADLGQEATPSDAEEVAHLRDDAVISEDGVDLAAEPGAGIGPAPPVTGPPPSFPGLGRRDPRLGQQVGAEQLGQGGRVDGVVLDPGRGDRLGRQGV